MTKQTVSAILVAAGSSTRMGFDKLSAKIAGQTVLAKSIAAFAMCEDITEIVLVYGKNEAFVRAQASAFLGVKPFVFVAGGAVRAQSAANGVNAAAGQLVAIHDAARPFVSAEVIHQAIAAARLHGAAAPAVPVKDTIKQAVQAGDGKIVPQPCTVAGTPNRNTLFAVQTPQCFCKEAYQLALSSCTDVQLAALTDDCSLFELMQWPVYLTQGEYANLKITTKEDLPVQDKMEGPMIRIGHGYDVHKLVQERKLILGGVCVPYEKGLLGHSDADVLVHAIMDAVLGAAALGDIGKHFPDTDDAYQGADSLKLAAAVASLIEKQGYLVGNIDATILCQKPKLAPHIPVMRQNIARAFGILPEQVSVKATTEEKLGFTGEGLGIAAHAVVLLLKTA